MPASCCCGCEATVDAVEAVEAVSDRKREGGPRCRGGPVPSPRCTDRAEGRRGAAQSSSLSMSLSLVQTVERECTLLNAMGAATAGLL